MRDDASYALFTESSSIFDRIPDLGLVWYIQITAQVKAQPHCFPCTVTINLSVN